MFKQAVIAFLVLPGIVAFVIPIVWLGYIEHSKLVHPFALVVITVGVMALLWCVRDFYISGKGSLAPWAPPQKLVVSGLYRYSRNPMYVSVTIVLFGWALSFASIALTLYSLLVVLAFHIRVVFGEEPWLAQTYGKDWLNYSKRVPRWFF